MVPWLLRIIALSNPCLGAKYSKHFLPTAKNILRRIFSAFAHMETVHAKDLQAIKQYDQLTLVFKHYVAFVKYHKLVERKVLDPINNVMEQWKGKEERRQGNIEKAK